MKVISVHQARWRLPRLLDRVAAGEELVIARGGRPIARLVRYTEAEPGGRRVGGHWKGMVRIGDDFDDPLPDEIEQALRGQQP